MMNMRIYVGNLSFKTTEHGLENAFARFGQVTDVKIMQDRETGRSRGFAFVTMANPSEGQAAVEGLNGRELDGRNLTVNEARPREERFGGGESSGGSRSYGSRRSSYGGRRG